MAFNFKYYGKTNPEEDPDARPLGEWTWDKLPMDQSPHIDWKTGTVRSPLFNASKPAEIPKAPELDIPDFGDAGGGVPPTTFDSALLRSKIDPQTGKCEWVPFGPGVVNMSASNLTYLADCEVNDSNLQLSWPANTPQIQTGLHTIDGTGPASSFANGPVVLPLITDIKLGTSQSGTQVLYFTVRTLYFDAMGLLRCVSPAGKMEIDTPLFVP